MSRCIDVRNLCVYSGVTFSRSRLVEINMTRKQATIAVRSGLNDDEQYGCVVPPIHLSSTYNFIDFNQPRTHDYSRRGNQRVMLSNGRWRNWKGGPVPS